MGRSKKTAPSLCFKAVPVLGDCCIHDSILESARFGNLNIVSEKATFPFYISCDSYRDGMDSIMCISNVNVLGVGE